MPGSHASPAAAVPGTGPHSSRWRGGRARGSAGLALPLTARSQPSGGRSLPGVFPVSRGTLLPSGRRRGRAESTAAAGRPLRPGTPQPRRLSAHLAAISCARLPRRGVSLSLVGSAGLGGSIRLALEYKLRH